MACGKVDYELIDMSSGGIYIIKVDPSEADLLNNDKEKRYRILNNLKMLERKPDRIWDSLIEDSVQSTHQRVPKKKKVCVGVWDDDAQWALMHELVPHRRKLRAQRYAVDVWKEVSQKLQPSHNLTEKFTAEQIAEKVKLMKRTLRDVKNGKRKTNWPFTEVMIYVFEKPIEDGEDEEPGNDLCSVGSYNSYLNGMPAGANSSSIDNSPATHAERSVPAVSIAAEQNVATEQSVAAEQSSTMSGDTLLIAAEAEDFITLPLCDNSAGNSGSGETLSILFENDLTSLTSPQAEPNFRREQFDFNAHSEEKERAEPDDVIALSDLEETFVFQGRKQEQRNDDFSDFNCEDRATDDVDVIALSDTEETFVWQDIKQELSEINNSCSDLSLAEVGERADPDNVIVLSDSEETFVFQEIKQEHRNDEFSDFNFGGSTVDGMLLGDAVAREDTTRNILPLKPKKSIGACRKTPKGRSPPKKGKDNWENCQVKFVLHGRGTDVDNGANCGLLETTTPANNEPQTPVKKKARSTVGRVVVPASPAKSLRRKPVQKNLVWRARVDEDFVMECVARKASIQQFPDTEIKVWKDVATALHEKGHTAITWELCRSKFDQMNNFFINTALKLGGKIGNNKWSHYDFFLKIHDIPQEAEIPENLEIIVNPQIDHDSGGNKIWTDRHVTLILDCYKLMKEKFDGTNSHVRHSILYAHMSTIMNQFNGVEVTGKQCQREMNELRQKFFEEFDGSRGTGKAPSKWRFFKTMREIFDGDANLDAPFVATVDNTGLSYTARGTAQTTTERGTRTRPPTLKSKPAKGDPKEKHQKKGYKSWPQQIQEKQCEQRQALVDEVRLLRLNFEMRSAQRMEMLRDLLQKL